MNNPFIIAEIGINHNGDLDITKKLIDVAVSAGCDAVKFQKRIVDKCYSQEFLDSPRESPWGTTQREQKMGLELRREQYSSIGIYCIRERIPWFASAWDLESQKFLQRYNLEYNKIASKMITNTELLEEVAREGKYTFISTGIGVKDHIDKAVEIFRSHNCPFMLMHCIPKYPCPDYDCALETIKRLKDLYNCQVGYSCHNSGILSPALAVGLGADAVEVHITLDRSMYGSDQPASFEKHGLELLVRDRRLVRTML